MRKDNQKRQGFKEQPKEFREELLAIDRVTRVTAGGRQLRFRASVVIGNGKGTVGLGLGKAGEVVVAIEKAVRDAKKNLVKFKIVDGTIAHDVTANYKSATIMLHPASEGTGAIAGGAVRKIISVSGIKDVLAKRYGCTNQVTNARATLKALSSLKDIDPANPFYKKTEKVEEVKEEKIEETKKAPAKKPAAKKTEEKKAPAKKVVKKEEVKKETKKAPAKKPAAKKTEEKSK